MVVLVYGVIFSHLAVDHDRANFCPSKSTVSKIGRTPDLLAGLPVPGQGADLTRHLVHILQVEVRLIF